MTTITKSRFTSTDLNECRAFLRAAGLDDTDYGWISDNHLGAIFFDEGCWHAVYWRSPAVSFYARTRSAT